MVLTKCAYVDKLPVLYFQIDGAWVEAWAEDYIFDYEGEGVNCLLFIMPANMAMNILGMPVHVDYYSIHDPVRGTVNWAPHNASLKETVQVGEVPPPSRLIGAGDAPADPIIELLLLVIGAGIAFGAIFIWEKSLYN